MTRRQKFDARPGTDWTIFLMLSIGPLGIMLNLTPARQNSTRSAKILMPPCLCENILFSPAPGRNLPTQDVRPDSKHSNGALPIQQTSTTALSGNSDDVLIVSIVLTSPIRASHDL